MPDLKVFSKSVIGSGHITKKMPCQDYSICENSDGIQVLVVCDGHGGTSYVRSHTGAKLAAIVTRRILKTFAQTSRPELFSGLAMAVTAKPQRNPFIDVDGNELRYQDLDETQQEVARQAQDYITATEYHQEEQAIVNGIISEIIAKWKEEIDEDARLHKFTKEEKALLFGKDFTKAYGCTVLAYLRTSTFWLALQIGDGKIICCDEHLCWTEPVPKDCECFLNRTTSLCDKSPEKEFRYAFSGKGDFPIAIFLNSDGVDGSFGSKENLQGFYTDVIDLFQDRTTDIQSELEEFLPKLSEQGNHDDMSIAGMVDVEWLVANNELMRLIKEERSLRDERESKKAAVNQLEASLETVNTKLEKLKDTFDTRQSELSSWWQSVQTLKAEKERELQAIKEKETKLAREKDGIYAELKRMREELEEWQFSAKRAMAEIEEKKSELKDGAKHSSRETEQTVVVEDNGTSTPGQTDSIESKEKSDNFWE